MKSRWNEGFKDAYYEGAADSLHAPFEPKTPCRNMPTRPCVLITNDERRMFPRDECMPHYCTRHTDQYEEGQIPHQWVLEESSARGLVVTIPRYFELDDYHGGPRCTRCEMTFCQFCDPKILTAICSEQDQTLPFE